MDILLRDATVNDIEKIVAIDGASFTQPWTRASFEKALADEGRSVVLVVEGAGTVLAYGVAWNIGEEGEIDTVAVDVEVRGQGLGKAMVQALVDRLAARGTRAIFLEVRPSNTGARQLYQRLKFTEVGLRPNYYNDGEAAIIMKLQLDD